MSTSPSEGFFFIHLLNVASTYTSSLLGLLVYAERSKSSNKMPNHCDPIAGTLTFFSTYLMVVFICQTNVRNAIPQAQSLWQHGQLFPPLSLPPHCPSRPQSSTAELGARRLQYRSYQSNRDIGGNPHLAQILRVKGNGK